MLDEEGMKMDLNKIIMVFKNNDRKFIFILVILFLMIYYGLPALQQFVELTWDTYILYPTIYAIELFGMFLLFALIAWITVLRTKQFEFNFLESVCYGALYGIILGLISLIEIVIRFIDQLRLEKVYGTPSTFDSLSAHGGGGAMALLILPYVLLSGFIFYIIIPMVIGAIIGALGNLIVRLHNKWSKR